MAAPSAASPRSVSPTASTLAVAIALAAVYLIWGSTYLGIRFALEGGWPALLGVSGGRMLFAGMLLYAVLRLRGVAPPTRAQWPTLAVLGALMMFVGNGAVVVAEKTVSSGLAAIAIASMPLWMGLFGAMAGRHPSRGEWLGIAIGFAGVLWLNAGSSLSAQPLGLVLLLIAPIAWAFGSVWSRGRDLPSPFMAAAAQMLVGGVLLVALGLITGERLPTAPTAHGTAWLAYLAIFGSIVGFGAYLWLLDHVRPALASSYAYVNPPIAVLLGAWLGGERFGLHDLGALALILCGVIAIARAKSRGDAPVAVTPREANDA
ncbi:drug/metabolite exporter YedA [Lysobacter brunescens]|uniref:Drug/metabolite exporter YedA n=1 Tax=Lysobacter brunescens TaxID=262323 RepID=A0ABW2YE41_9GAMM